MRRRLPPLNSLRAFEAVGRHGKLADAADELCVTLGAVSRQVKLMEDFVGFELFRRHRQGFTLTDKGVLYLQTVSQIFDRLDAATTKLIGTPDQARISVRVFTTFASEWLVPRLSDFFVEHPELDFRLSSSVDANDIDREDVDIGIRRGPIGPDRVGDLLYYAEYFPVCSPALLKRGSPILEPRDLASYPLLNTRHQATHWRIWLETSGIADLEFERNLWFDNTALAFRAAREGVGVALGQRYYILDDLREGRLIAPFSWSIRSRRPYYLVYPKRLEDSPHVKAFRDWLIRKFAETERQSHMVEGLPSQVYEVH